MPTFFEYLKEYDKTDRANWRRLKLITCGADTLHENTVSSWQERTGTKIMEGYGMTETAGVSHATPLGLNKTGSFGFPIPNVDAAIVDPETNEFLPPGEVGEMILSGPNITAGYWNNPAETERTVIELEGKKWLKTGDLVRMKEDGYFYFYDRKRDLIKYKGYSVFARDIEDYLYQHPQVKAAGGSASRIAGWPGDQGDRGAAERGPGKISRKILRILQERAGPLQGAQNH